VPEKHFDNIYYYDIHRYLLKQADVEAVNTIWRRLKKAILEQNEEGAELLFVDALFSFSPKWMLAWTEMPVFALAFVGNLSSIDNPALDKMLTHPIIDTLLISISLHPIKMSDELKDYFVLLNGKTMLEQDFSAWLWKFIDDIVILGDNMKVWLKTDKHLKRVKEWNEKMREEHAQFYELLDKERDNVNFIDLINV